MLLSAGTITFKAGTGKLIVTGTADADTARVFLNETGQVAVSLQTVDVLHEAAFDRAIVQKLVIWGDDGDDLLVNETDVPSSLFGGDGRDELHGGTGNDLLDGENRHDWLLGGDGHDTLKGRGGRDTLMGGAGNDKLYAGGGSDYVDAGAGNDIARGQGSWWDTVIGGPGHDSIDGGPGRDLLKGRTGNDTIVGGSERDTLVEIADVDFVLTETSLTGLGNDVLDGIEFFQLVGGPGDNLLDARGLAFAVTLDGGDGADTLLGGSAADSLLGGGGDDFVEGHGGDDTIHTHGGDDTAIGGEGTDWLDGGNGNDLLQTEPGFAETLLGRAGNDTLQGGDGYDLLLGHAGNDFLSGGGGRDTVEGGDGRDVVHGGDAADEVRGGDDRDLIIGGDGTDWLWGGGDDDILIGGSTSYDADPAALLELLDRWSSAEDYLVRIGLMEDIAVPLQLQSDSTVRDDRIADILRGNSGTDWFFQPGPFRSPTFDELTDLGDGELVNTSVVDAAGIPAFPGAQGYGAAATGGRGGHIIEVTNLNDDGPGSLRAAVEAEGPRIVVFKVGGTITLHSRLEIRNPHITIAGQTAPGPGITLSYAGVAGGQLHSVFSIRSSNVIVRYLRVRRGEAGGSGDSVHIHDGSTNIILDHMSITWASDENLDIYSARGDEIWGVTVQNSLIAEALNSGNGSALGVLVSGRKDNGEWRNVSGIDLHHNVIANNTHRNPRVVTHGTKVVNNLIYNWSSRAGSSEQDAVVDWIGNEFLRGPMSNQADDRLLFHATTSPDLQSRYQDASIYIDGNLAPQFGFVDPAQDNWSMLRDHYVMLGDSRALLPLQLRRDNPLEASLVPIVVDQAGTQLQQSLLNSAGASERLNADGTWSPALDPIDQRILNDVANGTGPTTDEIPTTAVEAARGYAPQTVIGGYLDSDVDGMPDVWEDLHNFDKYDAYDGNADIDRDGWTNVEEFLNGSHPRMPG